MHAVKFLKRNKIVGIEEAPRIGANRNLIFDG